MTLRRSLSGGTAALVALLATLAATVGLHPSAWGVGLGCGALVLAAVAHGVVAGGSTSVGPADLVTLTRVTLACGVAAIVAGSALAPGVTEAAAPAAASATTGGAASGAASARTVLVVLAVVALLLDAVDGRVARRTGTSSPFGARFDGEADAFLILVLSVAVARSVGPWVLTIGAARYVFGAAGWPLPWLRRPLPPRHWRKVVAAVQGVALTWAAAQVTPAPVVAVGLVAALGLLTESFGRDVVWLWRTRAT